MKNFIIFILIFTPLLLLGQSKKTLLVKKWEFKEFATEEKLDKKSRKMLEMAFKDFYLLFNIYYVDFLQVCNSKRLCRYKMVRRK